MAVLLGSLGCAEKIRALAGSGSLVSRILCIHWCGASVIYLSGLPSERCEQHHDRFTWPCNPGGLPQTDVTIGARELLPHVFTLGLAAGSFLWHFLPGSPGLCFQSLALCVVRTFL